MRPDYFPSQLDPSCHFLKLCPPVTQNMRELVSNVLIFRFLLTADSITYIFYFHYNFTVVNLFTRYYTLHIHSFHPMVNVGGGSFNIQKNSMTISMAHYLHLTAKLHPEKDHLKLSWIFLGVYRPLWGNTENNPLKEFSATHKL